EVFGTPDEPRVPGGLEDLLDAELLQSAAGVVRSEDEGEVSLGLYRRHCAVCHGITGDGAGPAALYQFPYPRALRDGVFKYKSTYRNAPPTEEDLARTLRAGMPGAAMPSFRLLPEHEVAALVQYVKYLAIRGTLERELIEHVSEEFGDEFIDGDDDSTPRFDWQDDETRSLVREELLPPIATRWREANARIVEASGGLPQDGDQLAAWVDEGRLLFHDQKRANCVKCHGREGQGSVALNEYDDWNKVRQDFQLETERLQESVESLRERITREGGAELLEENLQDYQRELIERERVEEVWAPPRQAVARTLQAGVLHGSSAPEDLFRRIHQGIAGTPMPGVGAATPQGEGALSDEEIWKLVAYVQSLLAE
ncbi:MAG: c-type cytochrome, partial [Planctomycetales bacterium]|nr:c-type cytochrome [Planctomycetales bacterium]